MDQRVAEMHDEINVTAEEYRESTFPANGVTVPLILLYGFELAMAWIYGSRIVVPGYFHRGGTLFFGVPQVIGGVSVAFVLHTLMLVPILVLLPTLIRSWFQAHGSSCTIRDGVLSYVEEGRLLWSLNLLDLERVEPVAGPDGGEPVALTLVERRGRTFQLGSGYDGWRRLWVMVSKPRAFYEEQGIAFSQRTFTVDNRGAKRRETSLTRQQFMGRIGAVLLPDKERQGVVAGEKWQELRCILLGTLLVDGVTVAGIAGLFYVASLYGIPFEMW